jgi:hypothetical protein
MEEMRNGYKIFVGKPEGKRPLERPGRRWEDTTKMEGVNWIYLAQDRDRWRGLVNTVISLRVK